jgi:hypothetical protein
VCGNAPNELPSRRGEVQVRLRRDHQTSGEIPNPTEWHALSDVEFDEFHGYVAAEEIYHRTKTFYRCPKSDHLWVFWDGIENAPQLYTPGASNRVV